MTSAWPKRLQFISPLLTSSLSSLASGGDKSKATQPFLFRQALAHFCRVFVPLSTGQRRFCQFGPRHKPLPIRLNFAGSEILIERTYELFIDNFSLFSKKILKTKKKKKFIYFGKFEKSKKKSFFLSDIFSIFLLFQGMWIVVKLFRASLMNPVQIRIEYLHNKNSQKFRFRVQRKLKS